VSASQPPVAATASRKPASRRRTARPSCEGCYFGSRMLCALQLEGPCSTFRPNAPEGLVPPTQPMLLIRAEPVAAEPAATEAQLAGAA
jgi:hypothetical protein